MTPANGVSVIGARYFIVLSNEHEISCTCSGMFRYPQNVSVQIVGSLIRLAMVAKRFH